MEQDKLEMLNFVAQIIFDKKGFNILALDLTGASTLTDAVLIAEGHIERHVQAIAKEIIEKLKKKHILPWKVEGLESGDWIIIDYVDFMVHLFMPGFRERYNLEKMWKQGQIIDLKITLDEGVV